ncbi:winged helix-turn-helix domain-containing protein [Pseudomonas aeruginosa]|nr:winged helix-turn-helix domain-containing protein [Pseudomonas aeruginosa]EVT83139.1 DNA-binding protein [Pseudomonas aeruginosa VRFPA09]AYQ84017.1 ArsR family transcriptional regulator [Pseudomonas aeruginosa]AYR16109.1 ArsR family transcriptional regulator [Pseudomonas aeruginosa]AZN03364.1 ArsR family transcriptional regulator [Pseudomonas aeruginosa]AZN09191.1 ArsR family transcriptional regulator [Pseudomonas aeruginosa]
MNQKSITVKLIDFTEDDHPFGNVQGKATFGRLTEFVDAHPQYSIFGVSLAGIEATDASFPRESVVAVAKLFKGERGFFLKDLKSRDLLDNWSYAAQAKDIPLTVWTNDGYDIIGPEISSSTRELLDCVLSQRSVTAAKVAETLQISVPNASTKLKKLKDQGYILRAEEAAESGGIEYVYLAIGESA